eukprot:157109_1
MGTMSAFMKCCFWILCLFIINITAVDIDCTDLGTVPGECEDLSNDPPSPTFKETECAKRIIQEKKGHRPYACQYFDESQVSRHLDQFRSGAAYIVKNFVMEHHNWNVEEPTLITKWVPSSHMTDWIGMKEG